MEELMGDLLLFVEPEIERELDLGRGFEFLDKELAEMYPEPEKPSNTKVVDKLVKVFFRDGSERWMLLHVEVQGNNEKDFARRMFEYYIRIFGKHGRPVAAIAVMTGKDGKKMPAVYEDRSLWMRARYEYKTLCITDYTDEELEASMNPFAAVLLVAREVLLRVKGTREDRDNVLYAHKELVASLLSKKMAVYGENKTKVMMSFLNNYVVFKTPEINLKFMERTDELFERKDTMGYFEQLAEIRREEVRQEGVQEGLEKAVRSLLMHPEFSSRKIAELVEVPLALVEKIKKELNAK